MTTVETVRGPIDSSELGKVYVHEHVFVLGEEYRINYQDDWDEDQKIADAVRDLDELKSLGIDTIMDPTVLGLGRYIPRIQKIAAQTELNIVAATGLYTYNDIPFQFRLYGPGTMFADIPEPLVTLFVRDIEEGIEGTGVKAAFLKCAIEEDGLTPGVERTMRAIGQAAVQTKKPITVHTAVHNQSGLIAQRVLKEEGVDLSKVIVGHSGDSNDLDYLSKLADAGSFLGMDRFGLDVLLPFEERVNTIIELFKRGYGDKIVIAHDASCFIDWFPAGLQSIAAPRWNFRHITDEVIPALLKGGLTDDDIDTILVKNPRRYFE